MMEITAEHRNAVSAELSRRKHVRFVQHCWSMSDPFVNGFHIDVTCKRIDQAIADLKQGKSTFLMIKWPYRHAKSTCVSRYLPPKFVGEFPGSDVIVTGYSFDLVRTFSRFARSVMRSDAYREVYPETYLSKESQSTDTWGVCSDATNSEGNVYWTGLGGSNTGKGGKLIICDDFFKSRQEAESQTIRDNVWDALTNDIMTRRAPACIFIILATPWHVDDPFGRIQRKMDEDPSFPRFEELKFPAFDDQYKDGVLWPERFSREWYESQRATLGQYGSASLLQCAPTVKGGNQLRTDKIQYYEDAPDGIQWVRGWDLASSEKQRMKDDPDYTAGVKVGVRWIESGIPGHPIPQIFIDDLVHGRWESTQRQKIIQACAIADGHITQAIESFGAYKDAYTSLAKALAGLRVVKKMQLAGDKMAKYSVLEPIFEAGNVFLKKADWNQKFLDEVGSVPGSLHDDIADALVVAYEAHDPHAKRVIPQTHNKSIVGEYKIDFDNLSEYSSLVCSIWVEPDLKTSVLFCLWNARERRMWPFGEIAFDHPRSDLVIVGASMYLRRITGDKVTNLKKFEVWGNKIMHSQTDNDIASTYQKYDLWVRENDFYDELGAVTDIARLIQRGGLKIHTRCERTDIECAGWTTGAGKPDPGYGFARALCNAVSACTEASRHDPVPERIKPFSMESQEIRKRFDFLIKTNSDLFDTASDEDIAEMYINSGQVRNDDGEAQGSHWL